MTTYPNPTCDMLNVALDLYMEGRAEIMVMNLLGQEASTTTTLHRGTGVRTAPRST